MKSLILALFTVAIGTSAQATLPVAAKVTLTGQIATQVTSLLSLSDAVVNIHGFNQGVSHFDIKQTKCYLFQRSSPIPEDGAVTANLICKENSDSVLAVDEEAVSIVQAMVTSGLSSAGQIVAQTPNGPNAHTVYDISPFSCDYSLPADAPNSLEKPYLIALQ